MSTEDPNGTTIRYTMKELLAEIREGIATIKATTQNHEERLAALERMVAEHEEVRRVREPQIDALVKDLDVKSAVADALEERSDRGFTRAQKVLAACFGAATLSMQAIVLLSQL